MTTKYLGTSAGNLLGLGIYYRLTLVADAGWYDGARFDSRARTIWDHLASSGMAMPVTQLTVTPDDTATTFDIKTTTPGTRVCAELVRWIEERTGGTVRVAQLERLGSPTAITSDTGRTAATSAATAQREAESLTAAAGQVVTGVRNTVMAVAVVAALVLLVYYGRRR